MRAKHGHGVAVAASLLVVFLLGGCAWLGMVETPDSLMKQGQQLYLEKKYDEATMKFERVIELDNTRWLAYVYLARSYMAKGSWTLAISNARLAYQAQPGGEEVAATLSDALLGGGSAAVSTGQFTMAIADFTEYVSLHPSDARGYLGDGQAYVGAGRYADALAAFTRGLQNDRSGAVKKDLLKGLLDGGARALEQGQPPSAVALLREYVQQDQTNAAAYARLGRALLETGNRTGAQDAADRALLLSPGQREAADLLRSLR